MSRDYLTSVHMGCSKRESMTDTSSKHTLPSLEIKGSNIRDPVTGSSLYEDEKFHFLQIQDWVENKGLLNVRAKTLHRRGVSREQHPRLEKAEEQVPQHYIDDVTDAIYSYETVSESGHHTSSTLGEWMSISNGWTTGNTTERSSVESMGEDEFDKVASRTVRQLFGEIESMLFEGETQSHYQHLQTECQDWVSHFPHMRILGTQKIPTQDVGYQAMPRPANGSILQDIDDMQSGDRLSVNGRQLEILTPPMNENNQLAGDQYCHLEEEIFAEDGHYEDIIAVDRQSVDEEPERKAAVKRRRRFAMPPITPNAVVRDNISNAVFDTIWSEVIAWLRVVIKDIAAAVLTEQEEKRSLDGMMETITTLNPDIMPPSRETSMLQSKMTAGVKIGRSALDGVLTISTKQLQNREKSSLNDTAESLMTMQTRPSSSSMRLLVRPQSVKMDHRKTPPNRRLPPLAIDRARTPNVEEDRTFPGVRGHRMVTVNDARTEISVISPPNIYRTMNFPPVVMETNDMPPMPLRQRKLNALRASSAVAKQDMAYPFRERERSLLHMETRPSTTQTLYRSDTPLGFNRRSSTPMGFSHNLSHMRGGLSNLTGPSNLPHKIMNLGVTGSGINPQQEEDTFNLQPHWGATHTQKRSRFFNMSSVR